jgi:cytoskeleton protein RodZ
MSQHHPDGFGPALRRRREELALSLEDLAASTRIRKTYLQALEEENLQALPGGAYALGFLRIYAQQLGLAVEPLIAAMHGATGDDEEEPGSAHDNAGHPRPRKSRSGRGRPRRLLYLLLLLAGVVITYYVLQLLAPVERPLSNPLRSSQPAVPAPPPQPAVPRPAPPPDLSTATAPVAEPPEVVPVEIPAIPPEGAVVRMLPTGAGTLKVSLDGQEVREYQLQPDQSLHWKVMESLAVELSMPGLIRIWADQQELPVAGYPAFVLTRTRPQEARP